MENKKRRTPKDAHKVEKQNDCSTEDYFLVKGILVLFGSALLWDAIDQRTGFADTPILFGITPGQLLILAYVGFLAALGVACLVLNVKKGR